MDRWRRHGLIVSGTIGGGLVSVSGRGFRALKHVQRGRASRFSSSSARISGNLPSIVPPGTQYRTTRQRFSIRCHLAHDPIIGRATCIRSSADSPIEMDKDPLPPNFDSAEDQDPLATHSLISSSVHRLCLLYCLNNSTCCALVLPYQGTKLNQHFF